MSNFNTPFPMTEKTLFKGILKERCLLSLHEERTYFIRLEFDSPLPFVSGDSLAIYPHNDLDDVFAFAQSLHLDPQEKLSDLWDVTSWLQKRVALYKWNSKLSQFLFNQDKIPDDFAHLDPTQILQKLNLSYEKALGVLERLSPQLPRYYSIASTPLHQPNTCDLLVTLSSFEHQGVLKFGLASSYLCKKALIGEEVLCFIHTASHFRLPEDAKPLIMIGPGTGVAPFRAFIQERIHRGHLDNWLFFGERTSTGDFFFEEEWRSYEEKGHLKLSCAFSRDQEEKIYVQHKLYQEQDLLKQWLDKGAILYICGDAKKMAKDVEETLLTLLGQWHQFDRKQSQTLLREYRKTGRYILDIY